MANPLGDRSAPCKCQLSHSDEIRNELKSLDHAQFDTLVENLARPPAYTTLRLNTLRETTDSILNQVKDKLAEQKIDGSLMEIHPEIPDVVLLKNTGPHQQIAVDREVIVDILCGAAVLRGADIFSCGVLAVSSDTKPGDKVSVYADINGTCRRGSKGPYAFEKVFLGNGVALFHRRDIFNSTIDGRRGVGVKMTEPLYCCPSLDNLLPELVFPQNLPSALCAHVLDPQPGDHILDMCAAPGGKTTHIGALMNNTGTLVAMDKARKKMHILEKNLRCWGVTIAQVYCFDSSKACDTMGESPELGRGPPFLPASFDRILLDAPCSALGQRPSLANKISVKDLKSYPLVQRKLIDSAVELLKPGGVLLYSTCTFMPDENEQQISHLLKRHPCMVLVEQVPHITQLGDELYNPSDLSPDLMNRLQRFHPSFIDKMKPAAGWNQDTIGFFIAKLTKKQTG